MPPKNSVSSRLLLRLIVWTLTTVGLCALAMLRNVCASIGPLSAAVFEAGTLTVCAEDAWGSPHCDAITMPTANEAIAMRKP